MSLSEAPSDLKLKINEINSGSEAKRKMSSLGIHIDDYLLKLNNAKWGPILIRNLSNGISKIAIGRGIADKIIVDYDK